MGIDLKTTYFLLGLLYVFMPLSTFFYLKNYRSKAIDLWCFGGLLNGIGLLIISFRPLMLGHYPDFVTFTLANALMITGYMLRIQSFKLDMQRPISRFLIVALILGFVVGYQFFLTFFASLGPRIIFSSIVISTLLITLAWNGKKYQQHFSIKSVNMLVFMYGLLGITVAVKVLLMIFGLESYDVLQKSAINSLMSIIGILAVIYSNLGYIALVLAKVEKDYLKTVNDHTEVIGLLEKRNAQIKDLLRLEAFTKIGTYGGSVVHEVMQPLTALRFSLENLESYLSNKNVDNEIHERLKAVKKPAEIAIVVVQSLRSFMIEQDVVLKSVAVYQTLEDVIDLVTARAKELGVDISIDAPSAPYDVFADQHQLHRVFSNIINNGLDAITRNSSHSSIKRILIKLSHIQQKQFVLIKIIDSGAGIPLGEEVKVFEWLETKSGGIGIGLALSKLLVESWQGSISAYAAHPNVDGLSGAVFELKLKSASE